MKWRMVKASLAVYAVIGLALWALAGCADRELYRPCRDDLRDPRPECNRDECPCEFPWAPWFDHCCYGQTQETLR